MKAEWDDFSHSSFSHWMMLQWVSEPTCMWSYKFYCMRHISVSNGLYFIYTQFSSYFFRFSSTFLVDHKKCCWAKRSEYNTRHNFSSLPFTLEYNNNHEEVVRLELRERRKLFSFNYNFCRHHRFTISNFIMCFVVLHVLHMCHNKP